MKKTLLTLLVLAGIGSANTATAQIADGSVAPDFTVVDISGTTHNLYDYLDQGKTVVIDLFATWCSPCWNYALGGAMDDAYAAYGPAGTNEMVFLSIESDGSTTAADLAGTGSNTTGNWVNQIPNPLIDDASVANLYELAYYPSIFMICPNRIVTEIGQISTGAGFASAAATCPTLDAGTDYSILSHNGDVAVCGASTIDVEVTLQNSGATTMTSCSIEVRDGATVLSTTPWTGSLASWGMETVALGSVSISGSTTLDIVITDTDANATNSTISKIVNLASLSSLEIEINIFTDVYPSETSWKIVNNTGTTVATGGPYEAGTDDQWGAGGPDALTTKTHTVTLPSATDCYSFVLEDNYGDGLQYGTNPAGYYGYTISTSFNTTLVDMTTSSAWNFGDSDTRGAAFRIDATSAIEENAIDGLGVYPNPFSTTATVMFNNNTGADAIIEVMNMVGQVVYTENLGDVSGMQNVTIDGSSFDAGIYMVNVKAGAVITSKRIVLTK